MRLAQQLIGVLMALSIAIATLPFVHVRAVRSPSPVTAMLIAVEVGGLRITWVDGDLSIGTAGGGSEDDSGGSGGGGGGAG